MRVDDRGGESRGVACVGGGVGVKSCCFPLTGLLGSRSRLFLNALY